MPEIRKTQDRLLSHPEKPVKMETTHLLFYTANLILITISFFAAIIKLTYHPESTREYKELIYPGQIYTGLLFLIQTFEIPYLFNIGSRPTLFYCNALSMLLNPPLLLIIFRKFFFPKKKYPKSELALFIPSILLLIIILLRAIGLVKITWEGRQAIFYTCTAIAICVLFFTIRKTFRVGRKITNIELFEYSEIEDKPRTYGDYIQWLPLIVSVISIVNFIFDDQWVKFAVDIVYSIITICFVLFTLNPAKVVQFAKEELIYEEICEITESKSKHRISDSRFEQLKSNLLTLFDDKQIYLTPHITLEVLRKNLSTNRNYLCETIARCGYKSFYDMVNSYRVKYAIKLIKEEPDSKMLDIAYRCGFSSAASMNKAFTQQGLPTPSQHRGTNA